MGVSDRVLCETGMAQSHNSLFERPVVSNLKPSLPIQCRDGGERHSIEPKPERRKRSNTGSEVHGTQRAGNSRKTREVSEHHRCFGMGSKLNIGCSDGITLTVTRNYRNARAH